MAKDNIQNFVFLEICDQEINTLLRLIRKLAGSVDSDHTIHVTLRGPYRKPATKKAIIKTQDELANDDLLIANTGIFSNSDETVVYYCVSSENLHRVWYKPDFPVKAFGFNPHISVYRGSDQRFAELLKKFLDQYRLELLCTKFRVTPYVSKQAELFPEVRTNRNQFVELIESGRLHPMFLDRLDRFVRAYKNGVLDSGRGVAV